MIRDFLEPLNIQVLEASSGVDAIEIASNHPGVVHLLLTDIEMPRMSGWEVATKITEARPGSHILFMSAGVSGQWDGSKPKPAGAYFIQKPFGLKELKAILDRILAK